MFNNENFKATHFGEFLLSSNIVAPGKEKFMIIWVRKFFSLRGQWTKIPSHEQLPLFINALARDEGCADWQIRQAERLASAAGAKLQNKVDKTAVFKTTLKSNRTSAISQSD